MKPIYRKYFTTVGLIWAGCFVLFLCVYILVLVPQEKSKKYIEKQLAEKKQVYNSVLKIAQEETKIRLNKQIESLRNKLEAFVIDFEDSANLTFDISQIAKEKNVSSFSIRTKNTRKDSAIPNSNYISENRFDISFTANFNQFATFLNALERHRPIVFVDKFTITRPITRPKQDNSGHEVNMSLAVFVRKRQDS